MIQPRLFLKLFFGLSLSILLGGCAVAPFATDHSGTPLGKGNMGIDTGLSPAPYFQFADGITDKVDVAAGIELQLGYSIYGYGKWSLYQTPKRNRGFSLALIGGGGIGLSVINTKFIFAGPIGSYRYDKFEFFFHPRYNFLMYDSFSSSDDKTNSFNLDGGSFDYILLALGAQYYFRPGFALGLTFVAAPPGPGEAVNAVPGVSFLFRF